MVLQISLGAQVRQHFCGTKTPRQTIYVDVEKVRQEKGRILTEPEVVEVYVHFTTTDNGSLWFGSIDTLIARLNDMRDFFYPHDICFLLVGYQIIQSTDLDWHVIDPPNPWDDDESDEVLPYIKDGLLNVFVHHTLSVGGNVGGGYAYNIPNHYLSIDDGALAAECCKGVLAHEVGHCLGLYHTFNWYWNNGQVRENVDRVGSCANCEAEGDLLCDTPADPDGLAFISGGDTTYLDVRDHTTNCVFDTVVTDVCADVFDPDETNIMSYFLYPCPNNFTTEQGLRALDFLTLSLPGLLAPANLTVNHTGTHSTGEYFTSAKQVVTFSSANLTYTADAILWSAAGNSVIVLPGTTFSPGGGFTFLSAQVACQ